MKLLPAIALLASTTTAFAADPATLVLPTPLVNELATYLAGKPYGEVVGLIGQIRQCVAIQLPDARGMTSSQAGQCDAVRDVLNKPPAPLASAEPADGRKQ